MISIETILDEKFLRIRDGKSMRLLCYDRVSKEIGFFCSRQLDVLQFIDEGLRGIQLHDGYLKEIK